MSRELETELAEAYKSISENNEFFKGQLQDANEIIMNQKAYIAELEQKLKIRNMDS